MSSTECDEEVFNHGTVMGVFNLTKVQAEAYCEAETKRTGYKHDWHFAAGRVVVKALLPKVKPKG